MHYCTIEGGKKKKDFGTKGLIRGSRSCRIGRAWRLASPYPSWVDASGKDDFSTFPPTSKQNYLTCHCAQSRISDIVEFTINIADLVSHLPGRAEKRDNFTVGVLKLQEQVHKESNGSKPARTYHNIHSRSAWPPSVLKAVGSREITRPLENNRR